ncbi:MAG: hypothetical protein ACK5QC_08100 [Bacteroidota bacterium]|jgi:hypothetical protein
MKHFMIIFFIVFTSCINTIDNNELSPSKKTNNAEISISDLSEKLKMQFIYKTSVKKSKTNSVFVEVLNPPLHELYFESRLIILRQRIILILSNSNYNYDSLFISFKFKEARGEKDLVCYTKTAREFFINRYLSNLAYQSFNDYLFLNVDGSKMKKFSIYLRVLKEMYPESIKSFDYVQLVYNYLDEKQGRGNSKTKFSKEMLEELKRFLLETKDWKEFNEEDINYFLNYKF